MLPWIRPEGPVFPLLASGGGRIWGRRVICGGLDTLSILGFPYNDHTILWYLSTNFIITSRDYKNLAFPEVEHYFILC